MNCDNNLNIKFFCRSFNKELYEQSRRLYADAGYPCIRLTDQTADGYFYTMLRDEDCDVAINVDEDCFITDIEAVLALVQYVVENDIANAGCPDGGCYAHRSGNPIVTNPFFNVLNLRLLRKLLNKNEIVENVSERSIVESVSKRSKKVFDYKEHRERLEANYPREMLIEGRRYDFSSADKEPYYPFFLWQVSVSRTLYLPNHLHDDGITTILLNHEGREMCRHTWFARFYSVPAFIIHHWQPNAGAQKSRIDNVIGEAYAMRGIARPMFTFADRLSFLIDKIIRWLIKIPQRIFGWRKKIKKKLSKGT